MRCVPQEDEELLARAHQEAKSVKIVPIKSLQPALDLWEPICLKGDAKSDQALLLLPEEYELLEPRASTQHIAEVSAPASARRSPPPLPCTRDFVEKAPRCGAPTNSAACSC